MTSSPRDKVRGQVDESASGRAAPKRGPAPPRPASPEPKPDPEGWESLAEEAEEGHLAPNPELEAALREAADAIPEPGTSRATAAETAAGEAGDARGEALQRERDEYKDRLLRLQADFDNFRKRALRDREEAFQYGHQNIVKDLLPTVDNLDRAIDHARQSGAGDLQSLLQGVDLVRRELLAALGKYHVSEIEALGKNFNPALHEAMAQKPDRDVAPNTVVDVMQKGYQLRDRLLRPARVIVASKPEGADEGGEGAAEG